MSSIMLKKVCFECFVCVTNSFVCTTVCHNNENDLSDSKTGCPILKVHIWFIMFSRKQYLQSFWRSVVPMAVDLDRTNVRAFKSSVKSAKLKRKLRKFVFIQWLPAKIYLCFSKHQFSYICLQNIRPRSTSF